MQIGAAPGQSHLKFLKAAQVSFRAEFSRLGENAVEESFV